MSNNQIADWAQITTSDLANPAQSFRSGGNARICRTLPYLFPEQCLVFCGHDFPVVEMREIGIFQLLERSNSDILILDHALELLRSGTRSVG